MMENPIPFNFKRFKLINGDDSGLQQVKILIVGVGGIGCQILKVLSKMPIGQVHIIDMDTIQLSNLNRQFLFKKEHKGMSKSLVARQTILKINRNFNIIAHHMNIKELPINFFKQFNFLIMALDNIQARNYVNKIGVRLNIPIIDAGTLGYKGNVTTIIPKQTKCYSCEPKSSQQKVFPVCTIRMRPQKPIHCIVWAKLLFEVLFGPQNDDNDLKDLSQLAKKNDIVDIMSKLFQSDILEIKNAKEESDNKLSQIFAKSIKTVQRGQLQKNIGSVSLDSFNRHEDKVSVQQNIAIFAEAFQRLNKQKATDAVITFEKDDDNIIHFIASGSNLRMHCFNIQKQSFNEVKNISGNIVPAIASTNSIVSGIQVVEMMKLLKKETDKMKTYFIQNLNSKILGLKNQTNLQTCQICHPTNIPVIISANLSHYTLHNLVTLIKQKAQALQQFSINYGSKQFYNSEDPKQTLLQKNILQLCSSFEVDLVITNQDTMKKVCLIWLIHDQNEVQKNIKIQNQEQLINNISSQQQEEENIRQQKDQPKPAEDDDDDFVMFDDEDSPELEIIQVRKTVVQAPKQSNEQDEKTQQPLNNEDNKNNQSQVVELLDSDQNDRAQVVENYKNEAQDNGQAPIVCENQQKESQNINREQNEKPKNRQHEQVKDQQSSDQIKKKVKQNEQ